MENKNITNAAKLLLIIWNVGLFAFEYSNYYVNFAFRSHRTLGGLISVIIYTIIYLAFCELYKGFRIASAPIAETVFSQTISFGISDVLLYAECCLISNRYVNIWVCAVFALFQMSGTVLLVMLAKRFLMNNIIPKKTVVVFGSEIDRNDALNFCKRLLKKYDHLFDIRSVIREDVDDQSKDKLFKGYETFIFYELSPGLRSDWIRRCLNDTKIFYLTPEIEDIAFQGCSPKQLLDTPLVKYDYAYMRLSQRFIKRLCDIIFSILLLVLASPFMLVTAIIIKLQDGGPVFFTQRRYTKDMKEFTIYKFRSMIVDAEKNGVRPCEKDDDRITAFGRFIRATRLDELPQLFNIIKGDMSFVGPRPERVEHVHKYTAELPEFRYRLSVKGGLTGYAQIYGKYNTSAYDKLRLDLMYIENQSFFLDFKLCLLTLKVIFERESTEGF
ncbi:MAG: sugar transferase [Lachnospiraceae bacterium]|nr:sugar transferase [Lachnospiraceae bacterium]